MTTQKPFRFVFCFALLLLAACGTTDTEEEPPIYNAFVPDKTNMVDLDSMIQVNKSQTYYKKHPLCETENKAESIVPKSYKSIGKKTHAGIYNRFQNAFVLKTDDEQITGFGFSDAMRKGNFGALIELETTTGETVEINLQSISLVGEPQLIAARGGTIYTKQTESEETEEGSSVSEVTTKKHTVLCTYKAIYRLKLSVTYYGPSTIRKTLDVDHEVIVNRFGGWF